MMQLLRKEKGFTLIEILIVVVILGILVGLAVPQITGVRKTTWANVCRSNRSTLESLAEAYNTQNSAYPGTGSGVLQSALFSSGYLKTLVYCPAASATTDTYTVNASGTVSCSLVSGTHAQ